MTVTLFFCSIVIFPFPFVFPVSPAPLCDALLPYSLIPILPFVIFFPSADRYGFRRFFK
jgi:hypothetical protein